MKKPTMRARKAPLVERDCLPWPHFTTRTGMAVDTAHLRGVIVNLNGNTWLARCPVSKYPSPVRSPASEQDALDNKDREGRSDEEHGAQGEDGVGWFCWHFTLYVRINVPARLQMQTD